MHWTLLIQELHTRVRGLAKLFGCVALPAISLHPSPSQTHLPINHYLCLLNYLGRLLGKETKEVCDPFAASTLWVRS